MANLKMTVRPPLAPIADDPKCKEQYEKLQAEFAELDKLQVKDVDGFIRDGDPVATLEEFNRRVEAYTQRRDAYNAEFAAVIETRNHVRANIKELWGQEKYLREEGKRLQKAFDAKWGGEILLPMPENTDLMFDNPDEWKRQSETCQQRYDEWSAEEEKIRDLQLKSTKLVCAVIVEQNKFEDIQKAADAAFEDMAKRTLTDGTVMTDEQLAEYNKTHPENV